MFMMLPSGEMLRVLKWTEEGAWVISCDGNCLPVYMTAEALGPAERTEAPEGYFNSMTEGKTVATQKRLALIAPLLQDNRCISDPQYRSSLFKKIAEENGTTSERIKSLYCRYLATGCLSKRKPRERVVRKDFDDAIRKYYFSAKKNSLRTVYELMILEQYTNGSGGLADEIPSWHSFRHYYDRYWSKSEQKTISRNGLTYYQRNERRLHGNAMNYRTKIGSYQLDETTGDVFLVSKFDRSKVIGRPYIYLAVDTCTQLIAGVYVGLEAGENALLACIANAAADKVSYCAGLGINISEDDWPSRGMPSELITDQGAEFTGTRMTELCIRYGVEINTLPPFRAEEKPLVERAMGLLQDSYTSMLQGKGGIGEDVNERWAIDYRSQAVLTLDEFRKIVIITIINLNAGRLLNSGGSLYSQGPETPSERWKSFYYNGETTLIDVDENELRLRALPRASAKVSRSGIVFNSMRYATPKDYQLKAGEQVEFVYDTEDTSRVFILDAEKNFISCPLVAYAGMMGDADERKRRERDELAHRVKMRSEILQVIADAESQAQGRKDIGVKGNRQKEKERLS